MDENNFCITENQFSMGYSLPSKVNTYSTKFHGSYLLVTFI